MNRKKLITILATITIIATLSVSLFYAPFGVSATYNTDSMTVEGVLATDNYVLFPFAKKNLKIGFSKYGEMVDGITKTGLAYDGYDAFAPPAGVVEWQWVEGWIINIVYVQGGEYKNVWAMATYSDYYDSAGIGGPWHENVTVGPLDLSVRGGRKTSGGAVTDPIKVLYDGPRRFVALLNTTIYAEPSHSTPLVTITFTVIFNKVKKQVIILKDIKRVDVGKNIGEMQIEFGDRGEWDLGAGSPPKSYAHIFENQSTVYNDDYQSWYNTAYGNYNGTYDVCQIIDDDLEHVGWAAFWPKPIVTWVGATQEEASRDFILVSTSTKTEVHELLESQASFTLIETPANYPQRNATGVFWIEDPMVFRNDVHMVINGSDPSKMVYYFRSNNTVKFPTGYIPGAGDTVKIVYKRLRPHVDMSSEPNSPFVIGEWAFKMYEALEIFRGVTVYGITDLNDGDDSDRTDGSNVLDTEVQYYLNETFNPYDLYSAVHKETRRWVDFHTVTAAEVTAKRVSFNLTHTPVIKPDNWTAYCNWAEKVEWDGALRTPYRASSIFGGYNYTFYGNEWSGDGTGNITITWTTIVPFTAGTVIKVLYSTNATWHEVIEDVSIGNVAVTSESSETLIPNPIVNSTTWTTPLGDLQDVTILYDKMYANGSLSSIDDIRIDLDIKIRPEGGYVKIHNSTYFANDFADNYSLYGNMSVMYEVTAPPHEHLKITGDILIRANHTYAGTTYIANYTLVYANLTKSIGGSYEWIVVGKNAATIDSAATGYITQAFDSLKEIHVKVAGMDMNETVYGPYAPFVMGRATTGTRTDYVDSLGRSYLRNDWCKTTPISSSNMIFMAGPRANLGTEYFNDFVNVFFAESEWVVNDTGQANKLLALTCWDRNIYGNGYGVISVYKDLNGTIGLLFHGYQGQDFYYACKWFWDYPAGILAPDGTTVYSGIEYLQHENRGVTDIVLKITYPPADPTHPTVTIVCGERLGTISEKGQHDCPAPWY